MPHMSAAFVIDSQAPRALSLGARTASSRERCGSPKPTRAALHLGDELGA
ncbi:MAG: hypothetical protein ACHQ4F_04485 [Candidatus Dormibacteria bacterium]